MPLSQTRIAVPAELKKINNNPAELYIIGDTLDELLKKPIVAIVGSRKMSPYGRSVTERLASELASKGVVIVSGLAFGVDACAQKNAIEAGGMVIAVLAHGLDQIYPKANQVLAKKIVERGGVILSEYPAGTEPFRYNFLARNRIISGLSNAVIITEAAARSGSLNTAGHALDQGKPVLVVPGNITSPLSAGTNNLIKSGAQPITKTDDVLELLNIKDKSNQTIPVATNQEEFVILTLINNGLSDSAKIQASSQLTPQMFNQTLTMLEISGKIKPLGNNHWSLS